MKRVVWGLLITALTVALVGGVQAQNPALRALEEPFQWIDTVNRVNSDGDTGTSPKWFIGPQDTKFPGIFGVTVAFAAPNLVSTGAGEGAVDTFWLRIFGVYGPITKLLRSDSCLPPCTLLYVDSTRKFQTADYIYFQSISFDTAGTGTNDTNTGTRTFYARAWLRWYAGVVD